MADSRRSIETEHPRNTGVDPTVGVEVFEANRATTTGQETINNVQDDVGFGNAELRNARVVTGDAEPTTFHTTDLRNSELNTSTVGNVDGTDIGAVGQGTNWGIILMVIAVILLIILLGSWIF